MSTFQEPPVINEDNPESETGENVGQSDGDLTSPRASKRARGRGQDEREMLVNALSILKATAGRMNTTEDPEVKSFCAFVAAKMNSYSAATRVHVQHAFFETLMQADRGLFEQPTHAQQLLMPSISGLISQSSASETQPHPQTSVISPMGSVLTELLPVTRILSPSEDSQQSAFSASSQLSDINDYV